MDDEYLCVRVCVRVRGEQDMSESASTGSLSEDLVENLKPCHTQYKPVLLFEVYRLRHRPSPSRRMDDHVSVHTCTPIMTMQ